MRFRDRRDGGRRLVEAIEELGLHDPVVLALPRGGVPVAAEVARGLGVGFDVIVARKVGAPDQPELGIGAVAESGGTVASHRARRILNIDDEEFDRLAEPVRAEVDRRVLRYRGARRLPDLADRDVVIVDDGLATGVTAEAAIAAVAASGPNRIVVAVPAGARDTVERLRGSAEVVSVVTPGRFRAVGEWYDDFRQTSDEEVMEVLAESGREPPG
jgi:putative phosphoribosyl transferase